MRVKTKRPLPFVEVGSIGTWKDNQLTFSGMSFPLCKEEIENEPTWFEIIEDCPVWENEVWQILSNNLGDYLKFDKDSYLGLNQKAEKRANLLAAAPDLWRFVRDFAETNREDFNHYSYLVEAHRILKKTDV